MWASLSCALDLVYDSGWFCCLEDEGRRFVAVLTLVSLRVIPFLWLPVVLFCCVLEGDFAESTVWLLAGPALYTEILPCLAAAFMTIFFCGEYCDEACLSATSCLSDVVDRFALYLGISVVLAELACPGVC